MKCNVGGIDRSIRVVLGIILLLVGLLVPMEMLWQVLVLVAAAIALITAAVRFCPINEMLACNTCDSKEKK